MFAHVASAPQNSATSNSELPFAAFRVPTIRPPPHNCGRGSMPAFRHVTQPREGEVATPHHPSTCTGNNQCLYPFPVALRLPQIETTIFAVSALYNETVSGPFREHRAYPSAVITPANSNIPLTNWTPPAWDTSNIFGGGRWFLHASIQCLSCSQPVSLKGSDQLQNQTAPNRIKLIYLLLTTRDNETIKDFLQILATVDDQLRWLFLEGFIGEAVHVIHHSLWYHDRMIFHLLCRRLVIVSNLLTGNGIKRARSESDATTPTKGKAVYWSFHWIMHRDPNFKKPIQVIF